MTAEFAEYIRILGRGPSRSRALTLEEAEAATAMICDGRALPIQVGALLVLMRYRGETPAELAGMVRALRATMAASGPVAAPDLDWPSYAAGRSRGLPWFVVSALLLASSGVRVFLHSHNAHQSHAVSPVRALGAFGIPAALDRGSAAALLASAGFAHMTLDAVCPKLLDLLELRSVLGIRTAANTVARMLNPLGAPAVIQGVFHPPYRTLQREAAGLLGQPRLAVYKGGGGEAERPAAKPVEVFTLRDGVAGAETWSPLSDDEPRRPDGGEPQDAAPLLALWRGTATDAHAEAVVVGTAAVALRLLGKAVSPEDADALAADLWEGRERGRF